jgi:hypothetical protein
MAHLDVDEVIAQLNRFDVGVLNLETTKRSVSFEVPPPVKGEERYSPSVRRE